MSEYIIYGSPISLFSRKLEAAFECYGLPFQFVRKNSADVESIERRAGTHQIPVLQTPENWMVGDTTPIIMMMDGRVPLRRLFPVGLDGLLVHILEEVLDEWVARTMVHYRWHYDENTVYVMSQLVGRDLDVQEARQQTLAQWGLRACRATGTESVTMQAAAEKEYLAIAAVLEETLIDHRYALGELPSAVDAALMGGLRGHTGHDPLPDMTVFNNVTAWNEMDHGGPRADTALDCFERPNAFAGHLLMLAREQYVPFIQANRRALDNAEKAFEIETYGEVVSYLARPYPERSRQMVVDRIRYQLGASDRSRALDWLSSVGLYDVFAPA